MGALKEKMVSMVADVENQITTSYPSVSNVVSRVFYADIQTMH
jgi:hypothetical protein